MGDANVCTYCHKYSAYCHVVLIDCSLNYTHTHTQLLSFTLPETNMAPENGWLEY